MIDLDLAQCVIKHCRIGSVGFANFNAGFSLQSVGSARHPDHRKVLTDEAMSDRETEAWPDPDHDGSFALAHKVGSPNQKRSMRSD
ncbi:hypothetical protein ASF36_25370 [Methylobacterium sp. Leaf90]|nr:hypothetical protein ASF36_25370 [Methylobacterium sp. Leaf90]